MPLWFFFPICKPLVSTTGAQNFIPGRILSNNCFRLVLKYKHYPWIYMSFCKLSFLISITYICSISSWVSSGTRRSGVSWLARLSWGPCITWWSLDKKVRCIQKGTRAYTKRSEENVKVKSKQKSNKYTKGQKVNNIVRSTQKEKKVNK